MTIKNLFHINSFALSLALKQRLEETLKCPLDVATGLFQVFTLKAFYFSRVFVEFCFQPLPEVGCIIQEIEHSLLKGWIYLFLRY